MLNGKLRIVLATFLVLLAASGLGAGQERSEWVEQVAEFNRYFRTFKDQASRVEAIRALRGIDCPEAVTALSPLFSDSDPEVARAALEVVGGFTRPESLTPLAESLPKVKDAMVRARGAEVLGMARFKPAGPILLEVLKKERDTSVVLRIAEALGAFGDPVAVPALCGLLGDRQPQIRIAALEAITVLRDRENSEPVVPLLADADWRVRSAAIQAAGKIRLQSAVDALIELLGDQEGRLKMEAADALYDITDFDYGDNQEMWRRQWERLKAAGFQMPSDEEMESRKAKRLAASLRYKELKGTTTYHGIPTTSRRMLFVIDVSGSMQDLVVDRARFQEGGYKSFQRLEIVKTDLIRTIENLDNNTYFNVLAFATQVKSWKKNLVQANILNRKSAISWANSLKPIGATVPGEIAMAGLGGGEASLALGKTNSMGSLLVAFGHPPDQIQDERALEKIGRPRDDLDTIFFLSDGQPTTGLFVDRDDILREVRKINRFRRVVIHTIAIGEFQKDFLQLLARENGGEYVDLGR